MNSNAPRANVSVLMLDPATTLVTVLDLCAVLGVDNTDLLPFRAVQDAFTGLMDHCPSSPREHDLLF